MPNGKLLALVRPFTNADFGGNLMIIDVKNYVENNQAYPDTADNVGYLDHRVCRSSRRRRTPC